MEADYVRDSHAGKHLFLKNRKAHFAGPTPHVPMRPKRRLGAGGSGRGIPGGFRFHYGSSLAWRTLPRRNAVFLRPASSCTSGALRSPRLLLGVRLPFGWFRQFAWSVALESAGGGKRVRSGGGLC